MKYPPLGRKYMVSGFIPSDCETEVEDAVVTGGSVTCAVVSGTVVTGTVVTGTVVSGSVVSGTVVSGTVVSGTVVSGAVGSAGFFGSEEPLPMASRREASMPS